MHRLFTQVHFLFWQLGQGQYATESIPLWPGVFYFVTFFNVEFCECRWMSALGSSSVPFNSFFQLLIHSAFLLCSFCSSYSLFKKIILFALYSVVYDLFLCILYWFISRIFLHYFARSCFVCYPWPCHGIFWVSLISPVSFGIFLPVILSVVSDVVFFGYSVVSLCIFLSLVVSLVTVS